MASRPALDRPRTFVWRLTASAMAASSPFLMLRVTHLAQISKPLIAGCGVVLGLAFAIFWTVRDDRLDCAKVHHVLQVVVRLLLAYVFINYGMAKLVRSQFAIQFLSDYDTPTWQLTPFRLTWVYFSYSYAFVAFIGLSQIFGALLLLRRRTQTAGALLLLPIISNIVAVNFVYGVPVKFLSVVYLLQVLYLVSADWERLKVMLWDNKRFLPRVFPTFSRGAVRIAAAVKVAFVLAAFSHTYLTLRASIDKFVGENPFYGAWQVEAFHSGDRSSRDQLSDEELWRKVYFEKYFQGTWTVVRRGSKNESATAEFDPEEQTVQITFRGDDEGQHTFNGSFTKPSEDRLILEGTVGEEDVRMELGRIDVRYGGAVGGGDG